MTTLKDMIARLPQKEQDAVVKRTADLIVEVQTLSDVRRAMALTQSQMASALNIKQASVSQIENRTDLMLSTLRSYVEAMGGHLDLVVRFANRPPVTLAGISDLKQVDVPAYKRTRKPKKAAKQDGLALV